VLKYLFGFLLGMIMFADFLFRCTIFFKKGTEGKGRAAGLDRPRRGEFFLQRKTPSASPRRMMNDELRINSTQNSAFSIHHSP